MLSSREDINSRCRRFDLLLVAVLAKSAVAMTAVVAVQVVAFPTGRWRLTVTAVTVVVEQSHGISVFAYTNMMDRTEMRTRERKE